MAVIYLFLDVQAKVIDKHTLKSEHLLDGILTFQ